MTLNGGFTNLTENQKKFLEASGVNVGTGKIDDMGAFSVATAVQGKAIVGGEFTELGRSIVGNESDKEAITPPADPVASPVNGPSGPVPIADPELAENPDEVPQGLGGQILGGAMEAFMMGTDAMMLPARQAGEFFGAGLGGDQNFSFQSVFGSGIGAAREGGAAVQSFFTGGDVPGNLGNMINFCHQNQKKRR